jgi:uncharacterized protein (TIGR03435 family)
MNRVIALAGLVGAMTSGFAWSQSAPAPPFEEATIRYLSFPFRLWGIEILNGSVIVTGWGLRSLIAEAYGVKEYQVAGGPDWLSRPNGIYEIDASAKSTPTKDQVRAMAQALLADRFQLKMHREMQDLAAYALVVAKDGPKMKESLPGALGMTTANMVRYIDFGTTSMEDLAQQLYFYGITERPVFNKTGLTANYDFRLEWTRDAAKSPVFTPLVERLGLKLEPITVSTEMVIVDDVEMPSEN